MHRVESFGLWLCAQVTIQLHRGKKRQEKETAPGAEIYQLTANAEQMVQSAAVRFLRLQLERGVFAASYDKLETEEEKHELFQRTQQPARLYGPHTAGNGLQIVGGDGGSSGGDEVGEAYGNATVGHVPSCRFAQRCYRSACDV